MEKCIISKCKNRKICDNCLEKLEKVKTSNKSAAKKCSTQKAYICVFCCHSSRAVHLELMMDKTTDSFIQAIKRMANRRGMPNVIHSDNAAEIIKA